MDIKFELFIKYIFVNPNFVINNNNIYDINILRRVSKFI